MRSAMEAFRGKLLFLTFVVIALIAVWNLCHVESSETKKCPTLVMAENQPDLTMYKPDDTDKVFRDFLPHHCDVVRIGGTSGDPNSPARIDGAWWACKDKYEEMKSSKDCLVYGLGSGGDVSFDKQVAGIGCEVHSFDISEPIEKLFENAKDTFTELSVIPNVRSWKHKQWNFHYHMVGLAGTDDMSRNLLSLPTIMNSLKHQKRIIHYFKIDIEGAEYALMKDIADMADRIITLSGEWHPPNIGRQPQIDAYNYLRNMETKGLRIFRRDFRFDFINPGHLQSFGDSNRIQYELYIPMSLMGEIYFVNIN